MPASARLACLVLPLGIACKGGEEGRTPGAGEEISFSWMEGYGFHWKLANHRLSYLHASVGQKDAHLSLIGGTSTTGVVPEGSCEDQNCSELPWLDDSELALHWARYTGSEVVVGTAEVELLADAEGVSETVEVPLSGKAKGEVRTLLAGLVIDTDHPLASGDACYNPAFGWHPRHVSASVAESVLSEGSDTASIKVQAAFQAGLSLEEIRQCVDAVVEDARVPVKLQLLVVAGDVPMAERSVSHAMAWERHDENGDRVPQGDPDLGERELDLGLESPIAGWSRLDFRFHEAEGLDRGAYLRSLSFRVDPVNGTASGHATNESPTQLSGFDYDFEGTVVGIEAGGEIERGTLSTVLPAELDEQGRPVVYDFELVDGEVASDE